jgi:hypothetical protein
MDMNKALAVLQELKECASYWGEYDVPIGIHERIGEAIGELLAQPETDQEPVAWITEWQDKQVSGSIWSTQTKRALSFTRESAPHVIRPAYIPLYKAPPKREPLSLEELCKLYGDNVVEDIFTFARAIEKAHGIGECNSHYKERHETFGEEV